MAQSLKDEILEEIKLAFLSNAEAANRAMKDNNTIDTTEIKRIDPTIAKVIYDVIETLTRKI
jgi:hypothetical protein